MRVLVEGTAHRFMLALNTTFVLTGNHIKETIVQPLHIEHGRNHEGRFWQ